MKVCAGYRLIVTVALMRERIVKATQLECHKAVQIPEKGGFCQAF